MGTVIKDTDTSKFAATARLTDTGASLVGVMRSHREIKTKFGPKPVFVLEAVDASCKFMRGDEEVFPEAGEKIEIIPATRLARQLGQVPAGSKVSIKYLGKKDTGGANAAHTYHVEVL